MNPDLDPGLYNAMHDKGRVHLKRRMENAETLPVFPRSPVAPREKRTNSRAGLLAIAAAFGGALAHPQIPEADEIRGPEKYIGVPSTESLKQPPVSSDAIRERAQAFARRGHQLEILHKSPADNVLPESDQKLDEEFSEHIAARASREASLLLTSTNVLTRDVHGQAFQALETAVDACITRVLRASLQDMEREEQKSGNLLQADLLAVRAFADTVLTFVENHPERAAAAEPIIEALIHHAEDQQIFAHQNTPETSPAYQENRASFDLFIRDLRGIQFRTIPYVEDRVEYIGDTRDVFAEGVFAAIHADLPWFITNRADIAADPTARKRTIGVLRALLILPSHNHARHHAMRLLLRHLERSETR